MTELPDIGATSVGGGILMDKGMMSICENNTAVEMNSQLSMGADTVQLYSNRQSSLEKIEPILKQEKNTLRMKTILGQANSNVIPNQNFEL